MNDNPLYEMFSMSGGTSSHGLDIEGMQKDLNVMSVDIFRAINNIHPKNAHPRK